MRVYLVTAFTVWVAVSCLPAITHANVQQQALSRCKGLYAWLKPTKQSIDNQRKIYTTIGNKKLQARLLKRFNDSLKNRSASLTDKKLKALYNRYHKNASTFAQKCAAYITPQMTKNKARWKNMRAWRRSPVGRMYLRVRNSCRRLYRHIKKNPNFVKSLKNKRRKARLSKVYKSRVAFVKACIEHRAKNAQRRLAQFKKLDCSKLQTSSKSEMKKVFKAPFFQAILKKATKSKGSLELHCKAFMAQKSKRLALRAAMLKR